MDTTLATVMRTMRLIADAKSHFDASVRGPVTYSPEPVTNMRADLIWQDGIKRMGWSMTDKGEHSRHGADPRFSPLWFSDLNEEDHRNIEEFIKGHQTSFWAIEGLFEALLHQCLNSMDDYRYLLRNFMLLWDSTNSRVTESEDCYSFSAIKGIGAVDVSSLPQDEQAPYFALSAFAVEAEKAGLGMRDSAPYVVREHIMPMRWVVQEPYRSMVMQYPYHGGFILDYLTRGYTEGDEQELASLLADDVPAVVSAGML
jgi:hypothetical protein